MLCKVEGGQFQKYTDFRGNRSKITELKMPYLGVYARDSVYTEAYQAVNWSELTALRKITVEKDASIVGLNLTTTISTLEEIDFQSVTIYEGVLENLLDHAPNLESVKRVGCLNPMSRSAAQEKRPILDERIRKINSRIASAQTTPDRVTSPSQNIYQSSDLDSESEDDLYGRQDASWLDPRSRSTSNSTIPGLREFGKIAQREDYLDGDSDSTSSSGKSDGGRLELRFDQRESGSAQSRNRRSNYLENLEEYTQPDEASLLTDDLGEYDFGYEQTERSDIEIICESKDGKQIKLMNVRGFNDLSAQTRSEISTVKILCSGRKVDVVGSMDFSRLSELKRLEIQGALISEIADDKFVFDGSLNDLSIKDCEIDENGIGNFINRTRSNVVSQVVTLANVTHVDSGLFTESSLGKLVAHFSGNKKVQFFTGNAISSEIEDTDEYDDEEFEETSSQGTELEVGVGPTPAQVEKRVSRTGIKPSQSGGSAAAKSAFSSLSDSNLQHLRDIQRAPLDRLLGGSQSSVKGVENDVRLFSEDGSELHSDPDHSSAGRSESAKGKTRKGGSSLQQFTRPRSNAFDFSGETANIQISYSVKTHSKAATLSNGDVLPSSLDVEELPSGPKTRTRSNSYPPSRKESKLRVSDSSSNLVVPEYGGVRRLNPHGSSISKGKHGDQVRTVSLWQSLGRKLRQNTLHQEALESSQKAGASRDNQSQIRQLGRRLNAGKSESDVGSEVDGSLSSSSTPTHRSLRDLGQRGNTFGSETNKQPFFSRTGAGVLHTGENLETSRSTGSNIRSQYQLLSSDFDIQAEGRVEERPVAKIADEIDKVLGDNLKRKYHKNFDVKQDANESKVTLLHKSIPVLEARSESVKVFKSLRNKVTELDLRQKALVVLGSLGIPPCPLEGIHVDTKGKDNKLADKINEQFDSLYLEEHEVENPHSPQAVELIASLRHKGK